MSTRDDDTTRAEIERTLSRVRGEIRAVTGDARLSTVSHMNTHRLDSNALRVARNAAGLRQADVAERLGRTPSAIAHMERGTLNPPMTTIAEIAEVLGVATSDLLAEPEAVAS